MKKIMSFLMISFIIAINIHVHAVSDYDGEACAIKVCRLRPLFEGNGFYGKLSFCGKK